MSAAAAGAERPLLQLVAFRRVVKGALRGFASVAMPSGLEIADCCLLVGKNGPFVTLPSKPVLDADGRHMADAAGKKIYAPVLKWRSRELADRFSRALVALVLEQHPGALDDFDGSRR
jgi:hypothetical protein